MKPELQRIKIAEACGWTEISERCRRGLPPGADDDGTEDCLTQLPDYTSDLNAIHDAELSCLVLKPERMVGRSTRCEIENALVGMCGSMRDAVHASAAQRAEAFLKTLNLWQP